MNFYHLFFIIYGFFSIIAQVTILRELIILFYGNEFFSGIVLGIWLCGTGLGSLLANRILKFITKKWQVFTLLFLLIAFFPLTIVFLRISVGHLLMIGEIISLGKSLLIVFLTLFPFCFLLGSLFAILSKIWIKESKKKPSFLISRAYFLETLGLIIGGLIFNFFLIESTFPFTKKINNQLLNFRFPNLLETANSKYGQIVVTKSGAQYNFFESGYLIGSSQQEEQAEYFTHTILTLQSYPKKVLLIGGGFNGIVGEILKYPQIEKIDYVELDPKLLQISQKYLPDDLKKALFDKKVFLHFIDGRRYLKDTKQKYDIIIFNLPNPSTALINRFYTKQIFEDVKNKLENSGIFAFSLFAPVDYLSKETKNLLILVNQTLKTTFPYTKILPEETEFLFIASNASDIFEDPSLLKQMFEKRNIKTNFFSADYLYYRLTSEKIRQINNLINQSETEKINTDFHPLGFYYQNIFWQTIFSFRLAKIFSYFSKINFQIILLLLLTSVWLLSRAVRNQKQISFISTFNAGLTLMSLEIIIIFLFQSIHGILYSKISLIFSIILIFLAIGNFLATKFNQKPQKYLKFFQFLIILYCPFFLFFIKKFPFQITFFILAGLIGFLTGTVFPLTSKLLTKKAKIERKSGFLYAADLLGATFGSLLPTIILIPVFGVIKTVFLLLLINTEVILLQKPGLCK